MWQLRQREESCQVGKADKDLLIFFVKVTHLLSYNRVPTQVLQSLIFVFPFVRPYKVLFMGYFCLNGLTKLYSC